MTVHEITISLSFSMFVCDRCTPVSHTRVPHRGPTLAIPACPWLSIIPPSDPYTHVNIGLTLLKEMQYFNYEFAEISAFSDD